MKYLTKYLFFSTFFAFIINNVFAQFSSSDVFREYTFYRKGDAGDAIRVGGTYDHFKDIENMELTGVNFELTNAIKAELVLEKLEAHVTTYGLKIRINDNVWIPIPEPNHMPQPQYEYAYHVYQTVDIPLSHLKQGADNKFRMEIDPNSGPFKWPQNLINGLVFRIYYDSTQVDYPTGKILTPSKNDTVSDIINITASATSSNSTIKQVDYIGYYEDISYEGDSLYTKWRYHYFHTVLTNHIGSSSTVPYSVNWNTEWLPDQEAPIKLIARIVDNTGMTYVTDVIDSIIHTRADNISVKLCKPYNIPKDWVTRTGKKSENIDITGDTTEMDAVKLIWTSWSPCYQAGLYINNVLYEFDEGLDKCYQYHVMNVNVENPEDLFKNGINTISNVQTDGMEHGMEIQYPGIMALVKYNENLLFKPFYNLSSETYDQPQKIYMASANSEAYIRYTLNGSLPNSSSALFTDSIKIDMPVVIKARCFKSGADSSHVASLSLDFKPGKPDIKVLEYVNGKAKVSMSTILDNAEIRYNINTNETLDASSNLYTGEIEANVNDKIKAAVYKEGWQDGSSKIFFVPSLSGLSLSNFSSTISVFPNPVSEQLNIQMDNAIFGQIEMKLTDILGNTIKSEFINKTKNEVIISLYVNDLKQGIYMLQLYQKNNRYAKIIVK